MIDWGLPLLVGIAASDAPRLLLNQSGVSSTFASI